MSENIKQNYLNHPKGIMSWLLTLDHKRIGLMYLFSGILFFFLGGLLALVMRFELAAPGNDIISNEVYNNVYTLHGAIMIFLFIIPAIPGALGNILLPLMVGAKDVAFPRLNLASFYIYSFGALFAMYTIINGGVDTGWTFYTPYSTQSSSNVVPVRALTILKEQFPHNLIHISFLKFFFWGAFNPPEINNSEIRFNLSEFMPLGSPKENLSPLKCFIMPGCTISQAG